jgi:hypothetical protein
MCVCTVLFWVDRMVIKNKDYPFTNDVMRIFQHKNDCQSPKQIINLFASMLSHLVTMYLSKFIQVEYNQFFYNKHTLGITINI